MSGAPSLANGAVAVIVTYAPDRKRLARLLAAVTPQVAATVIVHNGQEEELSPWLEMAGYASVRLVALDANRGIGVAQNRGTHVARQLGADRVLFLDQDSLPAPGMLGALDELSARLRVAGVCVGAVGPWHCDERNRDGKTFLRLQGVRMCEVHRPADRDFVEVDFLIASGSLVSLAVLEDVGGLDESLFIDHVDTEWCLRAAARGYRFFGSYTAVMAHRHGDGPVSALGLCIARHNTLRLYYRFRNAVALMGRSYVPARWKLMLLRSSVLLFVFHAFLVPPRRRYLRMMLRGVVHGLRGRAGRLEHV